MLVDLLEVLQLEDFPSVHYFHPALFFRFSRVGSAVFIPLYWLPCVVLVHRKLKSETLTQTERAAESLDDITHRSALSPSITFLLTDL